MTVSKQDYTVSAPWLNFQLADLFRQAFIDANLMSSWYDEWTTGGGENTVHHRVLRIVYDATKKYGTVYHWLTFLVDGSTAYSYAHQWDVVNHRPIGDALRDYLGNGSFTLCTGSGTCSSRTFGTNVLSTTTTLTRYTSGVQSNFSMFLLKGGTNFFSFFFIPPNSQPQPYVDLERNTCGGLMAASVGVGNTSTTDVVNPAVSFEHYFVLQNSIFGYGGRSSQNSSYARALQRGVSFSARGNGAIGSGGTSAVDAVTGLITDNSVRISNTNSWDQRICSIVLPVEKSNINPNRTEDSSPIFTDIPFSLYFSSRLPTDFGIAFHFPDSTMEVQDRFRVTPGVEEWEILACANYTHPNNPSPLVLARVI